MKFFNPFADIRVTRHNLRHWQQTGGAYFITFRMADSLPSQMLRDLEAERLHWQQLHPPPLSPEKETEYHQRFSTRLDQWLDDGLGSCVLRHNDHRQALEESLKFFQGQRYELLSYAIMPNHVHGLLIPHPDWPLEKIIFTWKRRSAGVIHEKLGLQGQFWQNDYFDRLIRDREHLENVVRYIRRNPIKARLSKEHYTLWESDLAQQVR